MDGTTLLFCPFCGSDKAYPNAELGRHWIECRECTAESGCYRTEAEAIAAWNARATKPCYATDYTHDHCKYSVNRGWVEDTRFFIPTAKLGGGTLTAEQVREAVMSADRWEKSMGDTGLTNTHLIIRDDGWQAIADELNAELGGGTCEVESEFWNDHGGYDSDTYEYALSCGHSVEWLDSEPPSFCPSCGAEVVPR